MNRSRGLHRNPSQAGFALLELTLALIISAIIATSTIKAQLRATKKLTDEAQAQSLLQVKEAVDSYTGQFRSQILAGGAQSLDVDGDGPIAPVSVSNVTQPTIQDLINLGFLPAGFSKNPTITYLDSNNDGIRDDLYLTTLDTAFPAGCLPSECGIKGVTYINTPIVDKDTTGSSFDGVAVGDIMSYLGADGYASLDNTNNLYNNNGTTRTNPLGPNHPGVVAIQVGIPAAGSAYFDDLTVKNLHVTNHADIKNLDVTGTTNLSGSTNTGEITVKKDTNGDGKIDSTDTTCVDLLPNGEVQINCDGLLDATRGQFISNNDPNLLMDISPDTGIRFSDAQGVYSQIFNVPGAITVRSGQLFIFNTDGSLVAKFENGNIVAKNSIGGTFIAPAKLTVKPGDACPTGSTAGPLASDNGFNGLTTKYFSNADGEILYCDESISPARVRSVGLNSVNPQETCQTPGELTVANQDFAAVGVKRGESMICKNGFFLPLKSALPNFVLQQPEVVQNGTVVNKPVCGYLGANPSGQGSPAMVLAPAIEASNDASFVRTITDNGNSWTVHLTESNGTPLTGGKAVALIYCLY